MWMKKVHMLAVALLVLGGLLGLWCWRKRSFWGNALAVLIALAALYIGTQRDSYLPFLGETIIPCSVLRDRIPDHADLEVTVDHLKPGAKVIFWAAEPATEGLAKIQDWQRAYLELANAGVATVTAAGTATLRIRKPQPYTVPLMGRLESHVHWRSCQDGGFMGPVQITAISH
jgi:hypothetical protein